MYEYKQLIYYKYNLRKNLDNNINNKTTMFETDALDRQFWYINVVKTKMVFMESNIIL